MNAKFMTYLTEDLISFGEHKFDSQDMQACLDKYSEAELFTLARKLFILRRKTLKTLRKRKETNSKNNA